MRRIDVIVDDEDTFARTRLDRSLHFVSTEVSRSKMLLAHLRSDESLAYRTHIVFQFRSALATSVAIAPVHRGVAFIIFPCSARCSTHCPLRIPDHYAYRRKVICGLQMIAAEDIETMRG